MGNNLTKKDFSNNQTDDLLPSNILIKLSSANKLHLLSQKDRGVILTNIFHFHTGDELMEMTPIAKMFFMDLTEVFEFNKKKYAEVVKRNRMNGSKNTSKKLKSQNNPLGSVGIPSDTKDKAEDKAEGKVEDKFIDLDKLRSNSRVDDKQTNRITADASTTTTDNIKQRNNEAKQNYENIYYLDFKTIKDPSDKYFCYDVGELVDKLGWNRFYYLALGSKIDSIPEILNEYSLPELKDKMTNVINNSSYYFNKLLK